MLEITDEISEIIDGIKYIVQWGIHEDYPKEVARWFIYNSKGFLLAEGFFIDTTIEVLKFVTSIALRYTDWENDE